jgi:hypothetical protein
MASNAENIQYLYRWTDLKIIQKKQYDKKECMHPLTAPKLLNSILLYSLATAEHLPFLFKGSPHKTYCLQVKGNVASELDYMPHHTTYLRNQIIRWILNWRYYEH